MRPVKTDDNSTTFFCDKYKETYHSVSGAIEESLKKFVEPCNILELSQKKEIIVLDICFGLGYNTAAFLSEIFKTKKKPKIIVYCLENDMKILEKALEVDVDELKVYHYFIKKEINKILFDNAKFCKVGLNYKGERMLYVLEKNVELKFLVGDALEKINDVKDDADVVFLDPFSPKKCPELWEEGFIKDVSSKCKKGCTLTTYSCARVVRDSLKAAGFSVKDGPVVGRRAPSTIAILK